MSYRIIFMLFLMIFVLGCAATSHKNKKMQDTKQLQDRVAFLERELKIKEEKIKGLEQQSKSQPTVMFFNSDAPVAPSSVIIPHAKQEPFRQPTEIQVQRALKNAGFYKGPLDGKIGPQTLQEIKDFQRTKGLTPDGKVGLKTWASLKSFLP